LGRHSVRAQTSSSRIDHINASKQPVTTTPTATDPVPLTPIADAADFNSHFRWENVPGLNTIITDLLGTEPRDGKLVIPHGDNVPGTIRWQLDAGVEINLRPGGDSGIINFGFMDATRFPGRNNNPHFYGEGQGYAPFTEAQKAAARIAVQNWDDFIAPEFQEVSVGPGVKGWAQNSADIWLANTFTGPAQAWAYYPGGSRIASDVWIADPRANGSNGQLNPGFYGLLTLNHELGHSLGLLHPGSYNFGDDTDGDGVPDPINYTTDAEYFQDSTQFTIMSYFGGEETGQQPVDWNVFRYVYPSTPMVDDIFVVQQKYGAEMNTRTGDTVYGFNSTGDVTNEAMKFHTGEMSTMFTIWDAGGNDTLDLSGYYTNSVIDLREGAYSSAGGWGAYDPAVAGTNPLDLTAAQVLAIIDATNKAAGFTSGRPAPANYYPEYFYDLYLQGGVQLRDANGVLQVDDDGNPIYINEGISWKDITGSGPDGANFLMQQNIGIAYGAIIENAIGGHGDDRINGNQAENHFTGGAGADTFVIADYSGVISDPTDTTDWSKTVVDTSVDTIMDFNHAEGDKVDLASFGHDTVTNVQYIGTDLTFSANGHDYTVHVLGAGFDPNTDIVYG